MFPDTTTKKKNTHTAITTAELTESQQKIYKSVHIIFNVQSRSSDKQKNERAIQLAEKYCGVLLMVRQFAKVTSEIKFL